MFQFISDEERESIIDTATPSMRRAGVTTDDDGTTSFTYAYAWSVGGTTIAAASDTLTGDDFDKDDTVMCRVTPHDGTEPGAAVTSNSVVIENTAPTLSGVSISPDAPEAEDTLTCAYTGYDDADGDTDASTIAWDVNGTDAGSGATLAEAFIGGDSVTCTVTAHDGTEAGTVLSETAEPTSHRFRDA